MKMDEAPLGNRCKFIKMDENGWNSIGKIYGNEWNIWKCLKWMNMQWEMDEMNGNWWKWKGNYKERREFVNRPVAVFWPHLIVCHQKTVYIGIRGNWWKCGNTITGKYNW